MFAIQPPKQSQSENQPADKTCTPNVLPCRIHQDGPIDSLQRYWTPSTDEQKNTQTAHFRGRKLQGRRVAVPDGYRGTVATPTDRVLPSNNSNGTATTADDTDAELEDPVKILEEQNTFDEIMVWDHEVAPAADDPFVKGVEEWVRLAEAMNSSTGDTSVNNREGSSR